MSHRYRRTGAGSLAVFGRDGPGRDRSRRCGPKPSCPDLARRDTVPAGDPLIRTSAHHLVRPARITTPDSGRILRAHQGVPHQPQARQAGRGAGHRRAVRGHGPEQEPGTLSFRVYRDPAKVDYLLFVEHFADQAAYDAHTGSPLTESSSPGNSPSSSWSSWSLTTSSWSASEHPAPCPAADGDHVKWATQSERFASSRRARRQRVLRGHGASGSTHPPHSSGRNEYALALEHG